MKDIRIITLDPDKNEVDNRQFDTMRDARAWVKTTGLDADFWDRRAELEGWHKSNVATLQLDVDGECLQDWFPEWTMEPVTIPDRSRIMKTESLQAVNRKNPQEPLELIVTLEGLKAIGIISSPRKYFIYLIHPATGNGDARCQLLKSWPIWGKVMAPLVKETVEPYLARVTKWHWKKPAWA